MFGAPSKKNDTGTCRMLAICCKRLAPIRLVPFSYFCTCWNVRSSASPSFSWLIPSIIRRIRTRLPTCLSVGLGDFLVIGLLRCPRLNDPCPVKSYLAGRTQSNCSRAETKSFLCSAKNKRAPVWTPGLHPSRRSCRVAVGNPHCAR